MKLKHPLGTRASALKPQPSTGRSTSARLRALSAGVALVCVTTAPDARAQTPYAAPGQLLPPPPPPTPAAVNTERELELSEREDSGRGLQFFWIDAEFGGRWSDFGLISDSNLLDGAEIQPANFLPTIGLGAGVRFLYFTAGARYRLSLTGDLPFWTAGLEGALRIPMGTWEPYALLGGGYLRTLQYEDKCGGCYEDLVISGGYAAIGGGIDYFVTPVFAVGTRLDVEVPFVSRDALPDATGFYASDGSAVGLSANLGLHLSLHF